MKMATTHPHVTAVQELIDAREFSRALKLIQESDPNLSSVLPAGERLTFDVLHAECLAFLGQPLEAVTICRRAVRKLQGGSEHSLYARACFVTAVAQHYLGNLDDAVESTRSALYAYKRVKNIAGIIRSLNWLGNALFYRADYENSLSSYRQSVALAAKNKMRRSVAVGRDNMARLLLLRGQLKEARATFRGNSDYYRQAGEYLGIARHDLSVAYLNILERRFKDAEKRLTQLETNPSVSAHVRERGAWFEYMGEMRLAQNRLSEAVQYLEKGIALCGEQEGVDESVLGQTRRLLAEVRLAQGKLDEALAECDRACASIRKVGERFEEGVVYRVMAEVHSQRGETESAASAFKKSADILRTIGARLEWAKTCLAAGRSGAFSTRERLAYLFEAERLFAEVGVVYWSEQTHSALTSILEDKSEATVPVPLSAGAYAANPIIIAVHTGTLNTLRMARSWAQQNMAILITGETGTGKDLLARYIHAISPRRDRPFVALDLNAIPETLWESELFGYRRGSFTGAVEEKTGLLESAAGGTVFLNEVGNLPIGMQTKLLEFLDTRQVRRLGDMRTLTLDVRIIAATNRPLVAAVDEGTFRSDLYFRLEQAPLELLPLRERREDIVPLTRHFLESFGVHPDVRERVPDQAWFVPLLSRPWRGNIRELRNFLWQLVTLTGPRLDFEFDLWLGHLMAHASGNGNGNGNGNGHDHVNGNGHGNGKGTLEPQGITRSTILKTLERWDWNQRAAARDLEMSEGNVRYLIRRLQIERPAQVGLAG